MTRMQLLALAIILILNFVKGDESLIPADVLSEFDDTEKTPLSFTFWYKKSFINEKIDWS